jgi:hypothetical protein
MGLCKGSGDSHVVVPPPRYDVQGAGFVQQSTEVHEYERHCEAFTGFLLQGKIRGNLLLRRMNSFVDDQVQRFRG